MKGICFFSIAYLILGNPYLPGTVAHPCISQIDINDEYTFSIVKLPSPSSTEDSNQVENQDTDSFSTLQLAATKACYESCSRNSDSNNNNKAHIMTYSNEFVQSESSPFTILDRHHSQLSHLEFLKPNEVYLVKYSDINNEGGSSGLGCFELEDNAKINHYSIEHSVCKNANSVLCGEKKNVPSFQSTSLNINNDEDKPMKYKHLKENAKLHFSRRKKHQPKKDHLKESTPATTTNTAETVTPTMPLNNVSNEIEPERKGNTNLTNIEIQSGKIDYNDNNVSKRKRSLSSSLRKKNQNSIHQVQKRTYKKKKAVIDHYRKNTEQLSNKQKNKNSHHLDNFSLRLIHSTDNDTTHTDIDSIIQNKNDTVTDFNNNNNNNNGPSTPLSSDTPINPLNKTNIYQVNENNRHSSKSEEVVKEEENEDFSIIRLPNAIESTTSATEICRQQFEENHLGGTENNGMIKKSSQSTSPSPLVLLHRRFFSTYGNMVISSWHHQDENEEEELKNDYSTQSHKECLMYNAKDNGIRFAPCSEASTVLCVKSLNEFLSF
ncbi:unnamed protein product [Cunninghamella blakesleeana]